MELWPASHFRNGKQLLETPGVQTIKEELLYHLIQIWSKSDFPFAPSNEKTVSDLLPCDVINDHVIAKSPLHSMRTSDTNFLPKFSSPKIRNQRGLPIHLDPS